MRILHLIVAAILANSVAGTIAVAGGPSLSQAVALRKGNFRELGGDFKAINEELKSGTPKLTTIRPAAHDLALRMHNSANLFPKGSGAESGETTHAKAEIWTTPAAFVQVQHNAIAAADNLDAMAASGNIADLAVATRSLGMTCKSCHEQFREND